MVFAFWQHADLIAAPTVTQSVSPPPSVSQSPPPTVTPRASATHSPAESQTPKTPGGSKTLGIVVGVVIGLVIIAVVFILVYISCNRKKFQRERPSYTDGRLPLKSDTPYLADVL
jgi:hypothetical protein